MKKSCIYISCKQALQALSFKIIRGNNSINLFSKTLHNAHFIISIPDELWENYSESIRKMDFQYIMAAIAKIYNYITHFCNMPFMGIQINSFNMILTCIQQLSDIDSAYHNIDYNKMDCFNQISKIAILDEMQKYVTNIIYNLITVSQNVDIKKTPSIISQIENYLNGHVKDDLSLVTVSQLFYLSPIYLSQLFKKETGELYINYITNLKMNEAKKLLLSTDLLVYEISEKLGYRDNKYFSKLFEKKVGVKPTDFRKNGY